MVIGLIGAPAAGKGTVAGYLERAYGAKKLRFSDPLFDILGRLGLPATRDCLIRLSEILRREFGETILAEVIARDIKQGDAKLFVVDGVRREGDIASLRSFYDFHLVAVSAPPETRYRRSLARGEKPEEAGLSYEQFLALEERSTEVSARELTKHADQTIDNNGTMDELYAAVDRLLVKFGISPL